MAMTFGAKAQIVESSAKTIKVEAAKPKSGYNRIMFNYSPVFVTPYSGDKSSEGITMHGGSMSYTRGISVSKKLPMFIETGLGWQINNGDDLTLMRFNIPVAFTYRFGFGENKQIKISPFTGFNFGINALTKISGEYYSKSIEDNYKRFQMGWLIGANFTFKRFNIQIAYTLDFMPLYQEDATTVTVPYYNSYYDYGYSTVTYPEYKEKTGTLVVGLGWEF